MNVGLIGTGAIADMHARAYRNIGYRLRVCSSRNQEKARQFAARHDAEVVATMEEVCRHPEVDFVDVCTLPDVRLEPVRLCAQARKHVQVQKPIAVSPAIAREMIDIAAAAGILLHVVEPAPVRRLVALPRVRARRRDGWDGCCNATPT